jgi:hypothetical protein
MSDEDRTQLARAAELHAPLARAARLGLGNGMGYAVFGVLSLLFAVVGWDAIGLVLGAVLLGVGFEERRQSARLRQADAAAPQRLVRVELTLLGAIVLYGVLGLTVFPSAAGALKEQLHDTRGLGSMVRLADSISRTWYTCVIGISVLYQGGMARYFHRRRNDVSRYLAAVPAWARDVVEAMAK